jgi:predicted transcriptional regulator
MGDLSDYERGQIVVARFAGASVTKTAILLGASRATVSNVMSADMNHGKTTSANRNSERKSTFTERDHLLRRIVSKNHRTTAVQVTAELNIHLEDPVSKKNRPTSTSQIKYPHYLLTYGAELFLRSRKSYSYSRTSQHFKEPEGSSVHKSPPLVPILSQIDPVRSIPSYQSKIYFNIV